MVMRRYAIFSVLLMVLTLSAALSALAEATRPTGYEVMDRVYARPEGKDREGIMTMTLSDHTGVKKNLTFKYYIKEYGKDKKSLITFLEPENLKGTGLLQYDYWNPSQEDERWLFLPAMEQGKQASSEPTNKGFLGSDFTYEEMGWRSTDEDTHTLVGEENVSGIPCWIVESVPLDKENAYSKVVSWINKDNYVQVKNLFYDRNGALIKRMTTSDVKKTDGYWTVYKTRMENVQKSHETNYSLQEIRHDIGLPDDMFDVKNIKGNLIKINKTKK